LQSKPLLSLLTLHSKESKASGNHKRSTNISFHRLQNSETKALQVNCSRIPLEKTTHLNPKMTDSEGINFGVGTGVLINIVNQWGSYAHTFLEGPGLGSGIPISNLVGYELVSGF